MTILAKTPIEGEHRPARSLMVSRIEVRTNALQSAGHAVLRTLCSRALRFGLNGASWLLHGLRKSFSFDLLLLDVACVLF
jgi:hypothetical protein